MGKSIMVSATAPKFPLVDPACDKVKLCCIWVCSFEITVFFGVTFSHAIACVCT